MSQTSFLYQTRINTFPLHSDFLVPQNLKGSHSFSLHTVRRRNWGTEQEVTVSAHSQAGTSQTLLKAGCSGRPPHPPSHLGFPPVLAQYMALHAGRGPRAPRLCLLSLSRSFIYGHTGVQIEPVNVAIISGGRKHDKTWWYLLIGFIFISAHCLFFPSSSFLAALCTWGLRLLKQDRTCISCTGLPGCPVWHFFILTCTKCRCKI